MFHEIKFSLSAPDRSIEASVHVPVEPVRPSELLPILHALTDAVVAMSESRSAENGETISCRARCGACCRQLVPITEPEAHYLADLVAGLPEERRSRVVERFREARERAAAVLRTLHAVSGEAAVAEMRNAGEPYFALGIACPFLEDESCSIHAQRPAVCREYLVTSSPDHCGRLDADRITRVPVPVKVSSTLMYFGDGRGGDEPAVLPLIDALDLVARRGRGSEAGVPGTEMFRAFLKRLGG